MLGLLLFLRGDNLLLRLEQLLDHTEVDIGRQRGLLAGLNEVLLLCEVVLDAPQKTFDIHLGQGVHWHRFRLLDREGQRWVRLHMVWCLLWRGVLLGWLLDKSLWHHDVLGKESLLLLALFLLQEVDEEVLQVGLALLLENFAQEVFVFSHEALNLVVVETRVLELAARDLANAGAVEVLAREEAKVVREVAVRSAVAVVGERELAQLILLPQLVLVQLLFIALAKLLLLPLLLLEILWSIVAKARLEILLLMGRQDAFVARHQFARLLLLALLLLRLQLIACSSWHRQKLLAIRRELTSELLRLVGEGSARAVLRHKGVVALD